MNIESVRELKQSRLQTAVKPLVAAPEMVAARAASARAVTAVDKVQRSMALGIAPHQGNDYRLAVRIQSRAFEEGP